MNFRLIVQLEHDITARKGQVMLIDGDNKIYFADPAGSVPAEAPRRSQPLQAASWVWPASQQQLEEEKEEDRDPESDPLAVIRANSSHEKTRARRVAIYKLIKRNPRKEPHWYGVMVAATHPEFYASGDAKIITDTTGRDLRVMSRNLHLIRPIPKRPNGRVTGSGSKCLYEVAK